MYKLAALIDYKRLSDCGIPPTDLEPSEILQISPTEKRVNVSVYLQTISCKDFKRKVHVEQKSVRF